ncbi:MAG: SRPBCC family protein [Pseudomonadota bacterium]
METLMTVGGALVIGLIVAMIATPRVVEYVETIKVNGSVRALYDATRTQEDLMRWSSWPTETGSSCSVAGDDGVVGAQTVFLDKKGKQFGYQEVTHLEKDRMVEFKLESKGPPHKPILRLYFVPITAEQTEVIMYFRNDISPPFHVFLRLFGVVRWTRGLHTKDLDGLRRFIEDQQDYTGAPLQKAA